MARALPALAESPSGIDTLVRIAVFSVDASERDAARRAIRRAAAGRGIHTASIQGLYEAVAQGRIAGFTVPAHNLRGLIYDSARAAFRAAKKQEVGAFIFEISRGEMEYCLVRPAEYSACVFAAALRENWSGPVFIQGDHFQFPAKQYAADPAAVSADLTAATREAVDAGFLNIDIDPSTLVDLSKPSLKEQQRHNYERAAELTEFIRSIQPPGVEISVGGEIGEVGKENSTVAEFEAFFEGYRERWSGKPISKLSVQTGTAHGGIVNPDGSRAKPAIDFNVLRDLSAACRRRGIAGTVQHGASTLPEEMFRQFPMHDAVEIHLATELQRIILDHPKMPKELRAKAARWVEETRPPEWKAGQTPAQNFEKAVKRAWGPLKREMWDMDPDALQAIMDSLEARFSRTFALLGVKGTRKIVDQYVKPVPVMAAQPAGL
ncbi:MAG: class II fructose-bisphosphate aldolase [Planctomycetes bacterium]|nr:class II fructose-bisphosphate aldolase [Planctomycetota bacterium]